MASSKSPHKRHRGPHFKIFLTVFCHQLCLEGIQQPDTTLWVHPDVHVCRTAWLVVERKYVTLHCAMGFRKLLLLSRLSRLRFRKETETVSFFFLPQNDELLCADVPGHLAPGWHEYVPSCYQPGHMFHCAPLSTMHLSQAKKSV